MGALRNSIILSCLCNDISSTEAPGETVTTPKLRSHRWYANMSISQLSISYLQEASAASQETEQSPHTSKTIVVWGKLVVEVMAPHHLSASLRGCHLPRVALRQQAGGRLFEESCFRDLLMSFTPKRVPKMSPPARMPRRPRWGWAPTDWGGSCLELTFTRKARTQAASLSPRSSSHLGSISSSFLVKIHTGPWEKV